MHRAFEDAGQKLKFENFGAWPRHEHLCRERLRWGGGRSPAAAPARHARRTRDRHRDGQPQSSRNEGVEGGGCIHSNAEPLRGKPQRRPLARLARQLDDDAKKENRRIPALVLSIDFVSINTECSGRCKFGRRHAPAARPSACVAAFANASRAARWAFSAVCCSGVIAVHAARCCS